MQKTKSNQNRGGEQPYIVGLIAAVMNTIFLMMIIAWVMTVKDLSETVVTVLSYIVLCSSSFVGSWMASRMAKSQGMKIGGIIGGVIFLLILFIGSLINGFTGNITLLIKLILCVLSGMFGGIVGVNRADKRKMRS